MEENDDDPKVQEPEENTEVSRNFVKPTTPLCGRRAKNCSNCGHHFTKDEYELWECPGENGEPCGKDRHCRVPVTRAGDACRFHGGKTPRGIESASFQHGRRSKALRFMPQQLEDVVQHVMEDPLDLTDMAVAMQSRFWEVVKRAQSGESQQLLKKAIRHCEELDEAQAKAAAAERAGDKAGVAEWSLKAGAAWNNIKSTLKQNLTDWQTWASAGDMAAKTTRVVESQRKRLVEDKLMLGMDVMQKMFFAMAEAVNRHVDSPDARKSIQQDFRSIALTALGVDHLSQDKTDEGDAAH